MLEEFESFGETPWNVLQLLVFPGILPESSFGGVLQFRLSTFERAEGSKKEANPTLWSPTISAGDRKHEKRERGAERAEYISRRELLTAHVETSGNGVGAARTRADTKVWLD